MEESKTDKLLMSDSLKGMVPVLEDDQLSSYEEAFIIVSLDISDDSERFYYSGNCAGLSLESSDVIKIDMRVPIKEAYEFVVRHSRSSLKCLTCFLKWSNDITQIVGPFKVFSAKIIEFDRQDKMCTLGVDLVKS